MSSSAWATANPDDGQVLAVRGAIEPPASAPPDITVSKATPICNRVTLQESIEVRRLKSQRCRSRRRGATFAWLSLSHSGSIGHGQQNHRRLSSQLLRDHDRGVDHVPWLGSIRVVTKLELSSPFSLGGTCAARNQMCAQDEIRRAQEECM